MDNEHGAIGDLEAPATRHHGWRDSYRLWPIKRPGDAVVALVILGLAWATYHQLGSLLWAAVVLVGTTAGARMLFVPTSDVTDHRTCAP